MNYLNYDLPVITLNVDTHVPALIIKSTLLGLQGKLLFKLLHLPGLVHVAEAFSDADAPHRMPKGLSWKRLVSKHMYVQRWLRNVLDHTPKPCFLMKSEST